VRLPAGSRPNRVQLLTANTAARVEDRNGVMTVAVPSVECHEVIAIDL
jgi:hypothetical protein